MSTRSLITVIALAVAPACASDGSSTVVVEGDPVDDTVAEGYARGGALADVAFDELVGNDYIVQIGLTGTILASMHDSEIAVADFASDLVLDDDIFAFAQDLIVDHDDANVDLDGVMRFYGAPFFPSNTADSIAAAGSAEIGAIRGSSDPDFTFVEGQVIAHASAQIVLDELLNTVGDGEMGDYILAVQDLNDLHLSESESLLSTFY